MIPRREFHPLQAVEIATAFQAAQVDYLFIGAILLGFPGTTQDVDVFVARSPENSERLIAALRGAGKRTGGAAPAPGPWVPPTSGALPPAAPKAPGWAGVPSGCPGVTPVS
jgi:hypothetical protein